MGIGIIEILIGVAVIGGLIYFISRGMGGDEPRE